MFTQQNKINVSRCNGCSDRCLLGACATIMFDNKIEYRPTIDFRGNQKKYLNKKLRLRLARTYEKASVALSHARTASKNCPKYTHAPKQELLPNTYIHCQGCDEHCQLVADKITEYSQGNMYLPKIGNKTIKIYTNKRGLTKTVPSYTTALKAFVYANKICKLCDNYKWQHTK